jgi:hypothetical protein
LQLKTVASSVTSLYVLLGIVPKRSYEFVAEILLDEGESNHAGEVLGLLLESRKDSSTFLEPADESFDDVATSVRLAIELDESGVAVLVFFRRDDGRDAQFEQELINPIGPVSLVAPQGEGPRETLAVVVEQALIGCRQQFVENLRFVRLAWREPKGQRQPLAVAENVDLGRKSPARAA